MERELWIDSAPLADTWRIDTAIDGVENRTSGRVRNAATDPTYILILVSRDGPVS